MPLPNTSPAMSPMPATVKSCDWMSMPISRKWRLTHSQRALGGDAHLLVVVAGRTAGGEGVAEPEAVLGRERIRRVGEGGGALVGGHDQVRVVRVVAHLRPAAGSPRRPARCR